MPIRSLTFQVGRFDAKVGLPCSNRSSAERGQYTFLEDILYELRDSSKWGSNQVLEKTALATRHQGVAENHRWSALPLGRFDRATPKYTVTEMLVPRSLWRTTDWPLINLGQIAAHRRSHCFKNHTRRALLD